MENDNIIVKSNRYINKICYNDGIDSFSYLNNLSVVKYLIANKQLSFDNNVTFLVGENGTGKSTLVEAIAVCAGFNAEGGSKHFNFATKNTVSDLWEHITIIKSAYPKDGFFLRAESFYNVATNIDDMGVAGYGAHSLHEQSHGESFISLLQNRFRGNGLYILDEPEAALSPSSR